jgi:hypothetical protein
MKLMAAFYPLFFELKNDEKVKTNRLVFAIFINRVFK